MSHTSRIGFIFATGLAVLVMSGAVAHAQNSAPNPFRTADGIWGQLPEGREWGSTSAVYPSGDGNIWVAERCGQNTCVGKDDVAPILLFEPSGRLLKSFGAGLFLWPHGIHVDRGGNVWVTDAVGFGDVPEGMGHVVYKFNPVGELLMTLGTKGISGDGRDTFNQPSDVLVAPDGTIFVADGHGADGNNRIVKFSSDGSFISAWGATGAGSGEFRDPHALAMDSQGRLFVGDRGNSRIQIFDQEGKHLATWTQFGRPSGLFIDENDVLYSADSESNAMRNPGWKRGIRIGSARDGWVTAFIPDPEPDPENSATSGAEGVAADAMGNVYGAEVGPRGLRKHTKR
jgi:sugar lactone lactonase YvrE